MSNDIELNSKSPMLPAQQAEMTNFITTNFRRSTTSDSDLSFEKQLKRKEDDESLTATDAYGVMRLKNVCDIAYMKPKYLRFTPTKKCCEKLRELLLDKWYFRGPNLLALTYGSTSFNNEHVRELVAFVNKAQGWFISTEQFNDSVPYHCLLNKKQNQCSDENLIMLQHWGGLGEGGKDLIVKDTSTVNDALYEYKGDKNKRSAAQEHSLFLFPDFTGPVLEGQLKLVKEFSKACDRDGHHEQCKKFEHHVAPVVLYWVDEGRVEDYTQEKQDTLMTLLKSKLPLIISGPLTELTGESELVRELKRCLEGHNVVLWRQGEALADKMVDLLVASRLEGLPRGLHSEHHPTVAEVYHTMCYGMDERCRELIAGVPPGSKGLKEYILTLLHYYQAFELLDYSFYCGYDIATFLNNAYNSLTKSSVSKSDQQASLAAVDLLTHGNTDFEHNTNEEWFKYLQFCSDGQWGVARILRRHLPNPLMKCLLAIQIGRDKLETRRNNPLLGKDHCKLIESELSAIEDEAKAILGICNSQQFDLSLILFRRYPEFCDNTILSLAVENDCKELFKVETNVHMAITNRWYGQRDSDQSNRRDNPMGLFLKEETVLEEGWCERVGRLVNSPRLKCCNLVLVYVVFIALMTVILLQSKTTLTVLDVLALVFVVSFLFVELAQMMRAKKKTVKTRIHCYLSSAYNIVDLVAAVCVILYFLVKVIAEAQDKFDVEILCQLLMSIGFLGYIIRFTQFLQMYEQIGPKLITIRGMLSDLVFFVCFLFLSMISYGIVSEYLITPSPTDITPAMVPQALFRPYINLFGELGLDTLEADISVGVCKYEVQYENVTTGSLSTEEYCSSEDYKCEDSLRCATHRVMAKVLLGLYMVVTVILLLNLLIAIFSKTYEDNNVDTYSAWQMQRYTLITEFETQCILPLPPFNVLYAVWVIFSRQPVTEGFDYYSEHVDSFERRANNIYHKDKIS